MLHRHKAHLLAWVTGPLSCWLVHMLLLEDPRVSHCTSDFLKQELSCRWKPTVPSILPITNHVPDEWTSGHTYSQTYWGVYYVSLMSILKNMVLNIENSSLSIKRKINAIPKVNAILSIPKVCTKDLRLWQTPVLSYIKQAPLRSVFFSEICYNRDKSTYF